MESERSPAPLHQVDGRNMSEEEYCHWMLVRLRQEYERQAEPWVNRLVRLKRFDHSVRHVFLPPIPEVSGPPSGGSTAPQLLARPNKEKTNG